MIHGLLSGFAAWAALSMLVWALVFDDEDVRACRRIVKVTSRAWQVSAAAVIAARAKPFIVTPWERLPYSTAALQVASMTILAISIIGFEHARRKALAGLTPTRTGGR